MGSHILSLPGSVASGLALNTDPVLDLFQSLHLALPVLFPMDNLGQFRMRSLNRDNVLLQQFFGDDLEVSHRINITSKLQAVGTFHVDDFRVVKDPHDVVNTIDRCNMRQKRIAETLSLGSSLNETSNVHNLQSDLLRL
jgi:hypothetical protein